MRPSLPRRDESCLALPVAKKIYASVTGASPTCAGFMVFVTQAVFTVWPGCYRGTDVRPSCLTSAPASFTSSTDFLPQDVLYLTFILIVSAYSLFLSPPSPGGCFVVMPARRRSIPKSSWGREEVRGRSCCPHEADQAPMSFERRGAKAANIWLGADRSVDRLHLCRVLHADQDAGARGADRDDRSVGNVLILFYGFATWGNAGFMREQVCKVHVPMPASRA